MKYFSLLLASALLLTGCTNIEVQPEKVSSCSYENIAYRIGEIFPASDGVNTCECRSNGQVECTEKEVVTNPAQCEVASDCEVLNLETFCESGEWACTDNLCNFRCDLNGMLDS